MGKAKIGITIGDLDRLFNSGIHQNALTVKKVLESSGHSVTLLNPFRETREDDKLDGIKTFSHRLAMEEKFDIIITVSFSYPVDQAFEVKDAKGTKFVACQYGNRYEDYIEKMFVKKDTESLLFFKKDLYCDARWVSPHFEYQADWLETIVPNTKVKVCPYVWDPKYLVEHVNKKCEGKDPNFNQSKKVQNVSIHEPNMSRMKNCMIPLSIVSYLNRSDKELISELTVTNITDIVKDEKFIDLVNRLDLVDKTIFSRRWHTGDFICSEHVGSIVTHQSNCELNYIYLDYLYYGYPLIHNSKAFKNTGYYYEDQNIKQGAEQLRKAIETHHENLEEYRESGKEMIWKHHYENPDNVKGYAELIEELLS